MSNLVVLLFFVSFMCRNTSHSPCKESMEYASQRVASLEKVIRNALTLWKGCINVANDGHCECLPLATFSQPFQSVNTPLRQGGGPEEEPFHVQCLLLRHVPLHGLQKPPLCDEQHREQHRGQHCGHPYRVPLRIPAKQNIIE